MRTFREAMAQAPTLEAAYAAIDARADEVRAAWADTLAALYLGVALDFAATVHANLVPERVKAATPAPEPEPYDAWKTAVLDWLRNNSATKVSQITRTTRAWIREYLRIGVEQGAGIDELARRLGEVPNLARAGIPNRAEVIARTETIGASNLGSRVAAKQTGLPLRKRWISTHDRRTRDAHRAMDGQERELDEPFELPDGAKLMYPGDGSMGASAADIIQCRCTEAYATVARPVTAPKPSTGPARTPGSFETPEQAYSWARAKWPHMEFDFAELDAEMLNAITAEMERLAGKYPQVMARCRYIGTGRTSERIPAHLKWDISPNWYGCAFRDGSAIFLNPKLLGDASKYRMAQQYEAQVGWKVRTQHEHLAYTFTHEFGHLVHFWLLSSQAAFSPIVRASGLGLVGDTVRMWTQAHKATKNLSAYAATDSRRHGDNVESWAEGFTALEYGTPEVKKLAYTKALRLVLDTLANPDAWITDTNGWTFAPPGLRGLTDEQRAQHEQLLKLADKLGIRG